MPSLCLSLLLAFAVIVSCTNGSNNDCVAFSSDGLAASYWQYYRLYDFRNVSSVESQAATSNIALNKTVNDASWLEDWEIRDYPRPAANSHMLPVNFMADRVSISHNEDNSKEYLTYLTLSTARIDDETQEGGEMKFKQSNVSFASIRVFGRVRGSYGAVAGIFTYQNDTQESDIELLTRSPSNFAQYSNQPVSNITTDVVIPGASVNISLPNNWQYTDWNVHRLDWVAGRTVVFVNEVQINTTTLNVPAPTPASAVILDIWSANSSFSGSMPVGGNATFDIQWIELLYNTTTAQSLPKGKVCPVGSIDMKAEGKSSSGSRLLINGWSFIMLIFLIATSLPLPGL